MELHVVTDVTFEDIIGDFGTYADLLLEHKFVGFSDPLYLDSQQNFQIMCLCYDHGLCVSGPPSGSVGVWENNTGQNHHPMGSLKEGGNPLDSVRMNYHADTVECSRPQSIISMSMLTYRDTPGWEGETVFFDMEELYEKCPYKEYLEDLHLHHPALPGQKMNTHPAIRTHPVTGKTSLCVSNQRIVPEGCDPELGLRFDLLPAEFSDYIQWFLDQVESEENRNWWRWKEGNFILWDNRCTFHSFTGYKYGTENRVFTKGMAGGDAVWYGEKPEEYTIEENEARVFDRATFKPMSMQFINDAHARVEKNHGSEDDGLKQKELRAAAGERYKIAYPDAPPPDAIDEPDLAPGWNREDWI
jgi:hypothetical protein